MRKCQHCGVEKDADNQGRTINFKTGITCRFCAENVRRYGVNRYEALEMLKRQGGTCAICPAPLEIAPGELKLPHSKVKVAQIDHDHGSNQVRGLLCVRCNTWLGKDKEAFLDKKNRLNMYWGLAYGT